VKTWPPVSTYRQPTCRGDTEEEEGIQDGGQQGVEEGKWKCHRSDGRTGEGGLCVCGAGGMRVARGRQRGINTFSSSPPFPLATQVETTVSPPVVVSSMEEPGELSARFELMGGVL
jgi:hypothetical protein